MSNILRRKVLVVTMVAVQKCIFAKENIQHQPHIRVCKNAFLQHLLRSNTIA
jgi:hypothetical protein